MWLSVAAACLGLRIWVLGVNVANDSYQYLSVANNIATGHGVSTSIPYYETELRPGVVPAFSTHFPPGYSLLIVALSATGLSGEASGYVVSFLAFVALAPLFLQLARRLGIHQGAARVALVMMCLNQALLAFSSSLGSELAFTAMTMAALLLIQASQTATQDSMAAAVLGGVLAAGAYWIRYAGLLMVGMLALLCVLRLIQFRWPQFARAAVSFFTACFCMAPILIRNEMLVGSWQGYVTKHVLHPAGIGKAYVVSMYHLFFGFGLARQTAPFVAVCLACVITLAIVAVRRPGQRKPVSVLILAIYAAVYTVGMVYLGITSDISFGERIFVPLLPMLLLLGSAGFTRWQPAVRRTTIIAVASIMVIAYGASNLIGSSLTKAAARHIEVQSAVSGKLRVILDGDTRVLVSADGQAVGYGLGRPVVGLVGTDYSNIRWTEQDVHDLMLRYGSHHILLFPGTDTLDGQRTSQFLRSLAAGKHPPWLRVEAENDRAILFGLACGPDLPACAN